MGRLDSVLGAGMVIDREYTVTDGNGRCEVIFRDTFDRVEGRSLEALRSAGLFDEHTRKTWEHAIDEVLDGETKSRTEQIRIIPFGSEEGYPYDLEITPLGTEGYPDEVCCSLQSVGPGRRHGETIAALESAARTLMTAADVEEVLEETAAAANDVLGFPGIGVRRYDPETELLEFVSFGARVRDIDGRPPYPVEDTPQGRAFRENETVIEPIGADDPYDREVFTETMYLPIGETGVLGVGTIGKPFTETDVQFAEILTEHAAAALRVVETTSTLREERERLELLRQILTRALRHNLRNEMSVIMTNAELLRDQTDEPELVDNIIASVENVAALSDKAELFEQVTTSSRSQHQLDLEAAVSRAVTRVTRQYPDAHVEVDCEPATVHAHSALDVAVGNLLENACEHADGEPSVTVDTTVTDERVELAVADDGPGIPETEVQVLESGNETALEHGSGLGLWVVNWVVEQSDARIAFDTTDGTRVEISLPRADDPDGL